MGDFQECYEHGDCFNNRLNNKIHEDHAYLYSLISDRIFWLKNCFMDSDYIMKSYRDCVDCRLIAGNHARVGQVFLYALLDKKPSHEWIGR